MTEALPAASKAIYARRGRAMRAKYEIKTTIKSKNPRYRNTQKSLFLRVNRSPTDPVWLSCCRKSCEQSLSYIVSFLLFLSDHIPFVKGPYTTLVYPSCNHRRSKTNQKE